MRWAARVNKAPACHVVPQRADAVRRLMAVVVFAKQGIYAPDRCAKMLIAAANAGAVAAAVGEGKGHAAAMSKRSTALLSACSKCRAAAL